MDVTYTFLDYRFFAMSFPTLTKFNANLINTFYRKYSSSNQRKLLFYWGSVGSKINTHGTLLETSTSPRLLNLVKLVKTRIEIDGIEDVRVTHIASGWAHSLIAFKLKPHENKEIAKVFSFGLNSSGQLGHGTTNDYNFNDGFVEGLPSNYTVHSLNCGRLHSFILFSKENGKNDLFGFGCTMYGQLGFGESKQDFFYDENPKLVCFSKPRRVNSIEENIVQVACGFDHTILLTENSNLYSMGWGADGQLGLGNNETSDRSVPSLIRKFHNSHIRKIVSTTDSTLALLDNGHLWSWGNSELKNLSFKILEPTKVSVEHKVVDVGIGGSFSAYVTDIGDVYTCGYGALGLGDGTIESLKPIRVPDLSNIKRIYCGPDYMAAISASGELFTWGSGGPSGRLGLGHTNNQFVPMKVTFPQDVIVERVACGTNHAIALCTER
ncbi:7867_t:CDS:2 [Acaulospora morrowiae]|uniref:7867_t:CDS:1 n=1 Tax=Acaulospora morrowiae TaxID=94023 RepID=A0A9N9FSF9_9GLOM|nr:7867_t:CDS:2 [Acaulospora morrowiae]